ncbi:GNAT family N-acetyltransferase, partial [Candidatus Bipolaricaulota bacterium]|nr:GNAT family N-acetyltransferase [Candidatus Bipolaricaulota bacterium]
MANPTPRNVDDVALRPVEPCDEAFLYRVFEETRSPERPAVELTGNEWGAFVRMQYEAQQRHYDAVYRNAEHSIILWKGDPVGRIWIWESESQIRLLDIAILPEYRGRGIGTWLLHDLQARASCAGVPLRHMVE